MKNIIVCGPTGAGKDTVIDEMIKESQILYPGKVTKGIYYKTRGIRPGEVDDGHFISEQQFESMAKDGKMPFNMAVDNYHVGYSMDEFSKSEIVIVNIDDMLGRELKRITLESGGKSLTIFLHAPPEVRKSRFMSREGWLFEEPAEFRMAKDASDPNPESHRDFDLVVENREDKLPETMKEIMPKVRKFIES